MSDIAAPLVTPTTTCGSGSRVLHFQPHVMGYARYLTNADIGATGTDPNAPWILNESSPHAYIIIVTADRG